jgi:hypothetical protein
MHEGPQEPYGLPRRYSQPRHIHKLRKISLTGQLNPYHLRMLLLTGIQPYDLLSNSSMAATS